MVSNVAVLLLGHSGLLSGCFCVVARVFRVVPSVAM